jgi:protein gp37
MSDKSTIEWTDATWNPVTGCTQVSPGCDHCYALRFAERFRGVPNHPYEQGFDLKIWQERLSTPLGWRKPRRIFVNSMSDLFHKDVPDAFIEQVFNVMNQADWHVFQVLTKRSGRLKKLGQKLKWAPHIWVGVSVESEKYLWRVNDLREVPSYIRFISAEPLLGSLKRLNLEKVHWVITGGESGPGARPCDPEWVREIRDNCLESKVAFFHKQWGGRTSKTGGRLLDGRTWDEMPTPVMNVEQLSMFSLANQPLQQTRS